MPRGKGKPKNRGSRNGEDRANAGPSNVLHEIEEHTIAPIDANEPIGDRLANATPEEAPNPIVSRPIISQACSNSIQDSENDGRRERITIVNGLLQPSSVCSRVITKKFKEKIDLEGHAWRKVSNNTKEFYFEEFRKHFMWDSSMEAIVKEAWVVKASQRYSDFLRDIRKLKEKPEYLSEDQWKHWKDAWNTPEFKKKQKTNSTNRLSETGPSSHTGGSISHVEHGKKLATSLGRNPTPHELFLHTHTKKHDGQTFVDLKAKSINDKVLSLRQELHPTNSECENSESRAVDEVAIYYQAVGGEKKRRVYGLGSQASSYYGSKNSNLNVSTARSPMNDDDSKLRNEVALLRDKVKVQDNWISHMSKFMYNVCNHIGMPPPPPPPECDVGDSNTPLDGDDANVGI